MLTVIRKYLIVILILLIFGLFRCGMSTKQSSNDQTSKILFLHHSTGKVIWKGKPEGFDVFRNIFSDIEAVPKWFENFNADNGTNYSIEEHAFPKEKTYGWKNYPFDYYNIWVKHGNKKSYQDEPTLDSLTKDYNLIIFKHCFPVSDILKDTGMPDINSEIKVLENYKLQYLSLKEKLSAYSDTKFLIWTSAAQVENKTTPEQAKRSKEFVDWVKNEWDIPGDNIFIWDFHFLETEGGLYLLNKNAQSANDSHPSKEFANRVAPLFCQRIVDVIQNNGNSTTLTGTKKLVSMD